MNGINAHIKETPKKKKRLQGTGGSLARTLLPMQGSRVRFLVGEQGPA